MPKVEQHRSPHRQAFLRRVNGQSQRLETVYHVFTHATDMWVRGLRRATAVYNEFVQENGAARLYQERYRNRGKDQMISEQCLKSSGDYPL